MADRSRNAEVIVVFVTCPSAEVAQKIAESVIEDCLAACVNVLPSLISIYRWKGKVCRDPESLLIIKTRRTKFSALCRQVKRLHPYSVPEVIALPVVAGSASYISWIQDSTSEPRTPA
jgi:periplasmic divalent cation tolerance protein